MNIGIYLENYRAGGLDKVVVHTVNNWSSSDDEFILFCNDAHQGLENIKREINRSIKFTSYPTPGYMRRYIGPNRLKIAQHIDRAFYNVVGCYLSMFLEISRLTRLFKKWKIEAILIHNGGWPAARTTRSAAIASKKAGIKKIIYVIHNFAAPKYLSNRLQERMIENSLSKMGIEFVTVSCAAQKSLERATTLPDIKVIYNGIENIENKLSSKRDDTHIRAELRIDKNAFLMAMCGTYEPRRGHEFIIKIMTQLKSLIPQPVLLIIGTGTTREKSHIDKMIAIAKLGENVRLLGYRDDAVNIINKVDVVVNPAQSDESFGLVAVEAMSLKRPVVATKVGGNCEVIEDGVTGFLVGKDDVFGFAEKLALLSDDAKLRKKMGESGYARYLAKFGAKKMAERYHEMIV